MSTNAHVYIVDCREYNHGGNTCLNMV